MSKPDKQAGAIPGGFLKLRGVDGRLYLVRVNQIRLVTSRVAGGSELGLTYNQAIESTADIGDVASAIADAVALERGETHAEV